ncbi:MAG: type II toxin-antitoxin system RelE/ParE family toxin, partial [Candidatus Taylorbacteria bacterium]|nr:type II toxin-antitoxin system RelE/ParE family toxin [Candidatus Taylorbacteria bacterium]
ALKKLTEKEKIWVKEVTKALQSGRFDNLDIKKLKIGDDIFRVKKGRVRIIYQIRDSIVYVLKVGHRKEDTYRL